MPGRIPSAINQIPRKLKQMNKGKPIFTYNGAPSHWPCLLAAKNPAYLARVRELPCCICEAFGEVQMSPTTPETHPDWPCWPVEEQGGASCVVARRRFSFETDGPSSRKTEGAFDANDDQSPMEII